MTVCSLASVQAKSQPMASSKAYRWPLEPEDDATVALLRALMGSAVEATGTSTIPLVVVHWPIVWKQPLEDQVLTIDADETWTAPIIEYIRHGKLPADKTEARRLKAKASRFSIIGGTLYKRSLSGPYMRCLDDQEARYIMNELHKGECDNHSGSRSLANKAIIAGYYWPTMRADAKEYVKKCDKCQRFVKVSHLHPEPLHNSLTPWPFIKWGMDIVGKLPKSLDQKEYILAMTNYFSKWIEAEAYRTIKDREVKIFV